MQVLSRALQIRCGLARRYRMFVHAGLHKTGTTALQTALAAHAKRLRRNVLLYPTAGRPDGFDGHHNIAWQLSGDLRFQQEFGTVDDVADEIARFRGDAVISSEDFETVLGEPERLAALVRHPALRTRDVIVVIYLREQVSYLESLFFEMLHHGMVQDASLLCEAAMARGEVAFADWIFHFDYAAVRARIAQSGARLLVRPYAKLVSESIVPDLLLAMGRSGKLAASGARMNERQPLPVALARFCGKRLGYEAEAIEPELTRAMGTHLAGRSVHLSRARRGAVRDRFAAGNESLARECGMSPGALGPEREPPPGALDLEAFFSTDTVDLVADWLHGRMSDERAVACLLAKTMVTDNA